MKITLDDYWMGRDRTHGLMLSTTMRENARRTVDLVNRLLYRAEQAGVVLDVMHPVTGSLVSSGWRPPEINAATAGAALNSLHLTCEAVDIFDPDGDLDEWLYSDGRPALEQIGLWVEHPSATRRWSHLQTKPPRSGRRFFYP